MRFTKYFHKGIIDDNTFYIINLLVGSIDILDNNENNLINNWIENKEMKLEDIVSEDEKVLMLQLIEKKYILDDEEELELLKNVNKIACDSYKNECNKNKMVGIIPSYSCNFKCPYCFENVNDTSIMTEKMVDAIFQQNNNKINNILFYGGEPFLPKHKEIIKYVISKAPNARYAAITNGYYLMDYYEILKQVKIEYLQITLDGDRELHNKTRMLKDKKDEQGTFDIIMKGIEFYINNGIHIKIRMNIHMNNIYNCLELRREMFEKYGAKNISFELQPIFQNKLEVSEQLNSIIYEYDMKESLGEGQEKINYNIMGYADKPVLNFLKCSEFNFKPIYNNCNAETCNRYYDSKGNIYSCTLAVGNEKAKVGQYYPTSYIKENSMLTRNIDTIEKCKVCRYRFICGGGCAYSVMTEDGNVMNGNCSRMHDILNHKIPEYIKNKMSEN